MRVTRRRGRGSWRVRGRHSSPSTISPGSAACSNRAATFTASPIAQILPLTHQGPRPCSPPSGTAAPPPTSSATTGNRSRISAAARTARSASSSCTRGIQQHRHHRIPNELLNRPPMPLDDPPDHLEVPVENAAQGPRDRAPRRAPSSRTHHRTAPSPPCATDGAERPPPSQLHATPVTKASPQRILVSTTRTSEHC